MMLVPVLQWAIGGPAPVYDITDPRHCRRGLGLPPPGVLPSRIQLQHQQGERPPAADRASQSDADRRPVAKDVRALGSMHFT